MGLLRKNSGITLIALIITIIVLLILAGVTIAALTGSDSAPAKAREAKEEWDKATVRDELQLKIINILGDSNLNTDTNFVASKLVEQGVDCEKNGSLYEVKYKGYGFILNSDNKISDGNIDFLTLEFTCDTPSPSFLDYNSESGMILTKSGSYFAEGATGWSGGEAKVNINLLGAEYKLTDVSQPTSGNIVFIDKNGNIENIETETYTINKSGILKMHGNASALIKDKNNNPVSFKNTSFKTITLDANGGTIGGSNIIKFPVGEVSMIDLPMQGVTNEGYKLEGWVDKTSTDKNYYSKVGIFANSSPKDYISINRYSDFTLTAIWSGSDRLITKKTSATISINKNSEGSYNISGASAGFEIYLNDGGYNIEFTNNGGNMIFEFNGNTLPVEDMKINETTTEAGTLKVKWNGGTGTLTIKDNKNRKCELEIF